MGNEGENANQARRGKPWVRWLLIGLGTGALLLVIFHGAILRTIIRSLAAHYAAKENLHLEFVLEGDPFAQVVLRNVRATPTGPTEVQSLEAGRIIVDYSLPDLIFHGMSDALKNVEAHDVTAVIDSSKALPTPTPKPNQKVTLPAFFPDRLELTNINLTIREQPQDMVIRNLNLGLYPNREGRLEADKVQIPGVNTWTNLNATTTYANRNLYIHNLTLDQNNQLKEVNLDASKIGQGKLALQLKGTLGGGNIQSQMQLSAKGSSYQTKTTLHAKDISLGQLGQYLGQPAGTLSGDVKNVNIDWQGKLDAPSSWNGTIEADLENVRQKNFVLDHVALDLTAANGVAAVRRARIDQGNNHVRLRGSIDLPKKVQGFGTTPGNFQIAVDAPDLKQLTAFMAPPATGSLEANGSITTGNNAIRVELIAKGHLLGLGDAAVRELSAKISATRKVSKKKNRKRAEPFYEGLTSKMHADLSDVRYGGWVAGNVRADISSDGPKVSLSPLSARVKDNILQVRGDFALPAPDEKLIDQPANLQFSWRAPQLRDYEQEGASHKVAGEIQADGGVRIRRGLATGELHLQGQNITVDKLRVRQVSAEASMANRTIYLNDLRATMNEKDYVQAQGQVDLKKPYPYRGTLTCNLTDLSAFAPLVSSGDKKTPLAGSLVINWKGRGNAATFRNNGDLTLKLEHGRYADLQNLEANIEAHYTPEQLDVPVIFLGSDKVDFQTSLQAKGSTLEASNIQIYQGNSKYATAYVSLPFTWSNLGTSRPLFPPNGKVAINFDAENLDIAKLFRDLGEKPPAVGQFSVKMAARGPLDRLQADLDLQMQSLRASAYENLEPATINVGLRLRNNELRLDGKVQQARIEPVQIQARLPLNVATVLDRKKVDERTPINASVQMPRSSMNFVREFVPGMRQIDGTMALNVRVGGTIAKPALSGTADVNINIARFENSTLPALTDFKAQLNFRNNTLHFDRFGGDLAGGPFTVSGRITLPKLTQPNFDLHLTAKSVLVARNDNLTARVDADIKVEGPMKAATVSGQVLTTNSRFFKNIDIIPIALPGRPAPHPEPPSAAPELSFPTPPLRDWKFDITIKSKEPFLIRGNLATGGALVDMKIAGTGLHPQLQGQVRMENFEATLPFSTLTINLGFLYFNPDDPLNPRLELQGVSLIRDYTIHVYVYGTATAPQAVFSSEPPLPQEEIISLLATGTTRAELGTGNVLASRAAILLVKQLYRKIFKKGAQPERNDSFFSRLDVEFGNTDPRTGEQTATARYKASEHFVLIGDLGVQGGFRGLVKYLIRFR